MADDIKELLENYGKTLLENQKLLEKVNQNYEEALGRNTELVEKVNELTENLSELKEVVNELVPQDKERTKRVCEDGKKVGVRIVEAFRSLHTIEPLEYRDLKTGKRESWNIEFNPEQHDLCKLLTVNISYSVIIG